MMLAIDVGQSEARLAAIDADGRRDWRDAGFDPAEGPLGGAERIVGRAVDRLGVASVEVVSAGATGLFGQVPPLSGLGRQLSDRFGVQRLILADDGLTSALGATGGSPGVVAAIGTGLVVVGIGPHDVLARVDGAGAVLGDEGSGFWIGRRGLVAAVRSSDGRSRGSEALREAAELRFGPIELLPDLLRNSASPASAVAGFARDVAQLARAGDPLAVSIWDEAGRCVADSLAAAADRSSQPDPIRYYLVGGVAGSSELLQPAIDLSLEETGRRWTRTAPQGDALSGALALAGGFEWLHTTSLVGEHVSPPDHKRSQ